MDTLSDGPLGRFGITLRPEQMPPRRSPSPTTRALQKTMTMTTDAQSVAVDLASALGRTGQLEAEEEEQQQELGDGMGNQEEGGSPGEDGLASPQK